MSSDKPVLCPSAQPDIDDAVAFGVVERDEGKSRVRWIERPVPVTDELLSKTGDVAPTHVLRIAGTCQERSCAHFDGSDCNLAKRLVDMLDPVAAKPPPCSLRQQCRWYVQEGVSACRRCPQIVTESYSPDDTMREAAKPPRLETQPSST